MYKIKLYQKQEIVEAEIERAKRLYPKLRPSFGFAVVEHPKEMQMIRWIQYFRKNGFSYTEIAACMRKLELFGYNCGSIPKFSKYQIQRILQRFPVPKGPKNTDEFRELVYAGMTTIVMP